MAAACVHAPGDTFAAALSAKRSSVSLFLASNHPDGVPSVAVERPRTIWIDLKAVHSIRALPDAVGDIHKRIIVEQYRFSWPVVRAHADHEIPAIIGALNTVTSGHNFTAPELACCSGRFKGQIAVDQLAWLSHLSEELDAVRIQILAAHAELTFDAILALHASIEALWTKSLSRGREHEVMTAVSSMATALQVPITYHLRKITWLVEGFRAFRAFGDSKTLSTWRGFELEITRLPPQHVIFAPSSHDPYLLSQVRSVYTDDYELSPAYDRDLPVIHQSFKADFPSTGIVVAHPECTILHFSHDNIDDMFYIGQSELSCLACNDLLKAHNACSSGCKKAFVRGSHGLTFKSWAPPVLACQPEDEALDPLRKQLCISLRIRLEQALIAYRVRLSHMHVTVQ
ncbi:hypothetical protein EXIGLDRAFT_808205 [Exidia glandulosa HHB12029]|uniref:Uncharacterized protein n=1 Tax=Exidia glandulosa HHB12029 TaxID=1314781 RepID=A0A165LVJ4_EXIGL|nr:hypothetical protein EXIGLDRAFT_808205 [Exidia glandulosa HHB12029]